MKNIPKEDDLFKYRILFNGYNLVNEISIGASSLPSQNEKYDESQVYYDDYYGRFFTGGFLNNYSHIYGVNLKNYDHGAKIDLQEVDCLRVPYRRIPIYKAHNLQEIINAVEQMKLHSPDYKFLFRGQGKIYTIDRPDEERKELYGCIMPIKEPSFLPSFLRQNLSYHKVVSAWHNLCALLLEELSEKHFDEFWDYRHFEKFHLLALGLAQHYGLPSIGLDLTDNVKVALWFAINKATYSNKAPVKAELINEKDSEPTIFIFRCSPDTIFCYADLVKNLGAHRPQNQNAYFNHCGWGVAKNQLALNLACAFRVDSSFAKELPDNYMEYLFPRLEDDEVLRSFLRIKDFYQGTDLGKMLEGIYL